MLSVSSDTPSSFHPPTANPAHAMPSTTNPISCLQVPLLTVQADFNTDLGDVLARRVDKASFWCSLYNPTNSSKPSLHGTVAVSPEPSSFTSVKVKADLDEFRIGYIDTNALSFTYLPAGEQSTTTTTTRIQAPARAYKGQGLPKSVNCLDVSPQGDLLLVGGTDGNLKIVDPKDGSVRRDLQGHKADVECCKFFPSGKVVLSGGLDLTIRIWDALDGSSPVQLKGHTRGVLDLAIVSRGRNVLSCSRDGTVLLHEPSSGAVISKLASLPDPINKISLGQRPAEAGSTFGASRLDSREVDTEGKIVWAACEDGTLRSWDLGSKEAAFGARPSGAAPLTCVTYSAAQNLVVCGSNNGEISLFDVRKMSAENSTPVFMFRRNTAAISSVGLLSAPEPGLLVSTKDGQAYVVAKPGELAEGVLPHVRNELVGPDIEAVNCAVAFTGDGRAPEVYAGAKDGIVRKYLVR